MNLMRAGIGHIEHFVAAGEARWALKSYCDVGLFSLVGILCEDHQRRLALIGHADFARGQDHRVCGARPR
jgi:hypothetical protein